MGGAQQNPSTFSAPCLDGFRCAPPILQFLQNCMQFLGSSVVFSHPGTAMRTARRHCAAARIRPKSVCYIATSQYLDNITTKNAEQKPPPDRKTPFPLSVWKQKKAPFCFQVIPWFFLTGKTWKQKGAFIGLAPQTMITMPVSSWSFSRTRFKMIFAGSSLFFPPPR